MGEEDGSVNWYEADPRAVMPLYSEDGLKIPRTLRQVISRNDFDIRHNTEFETVIRLCSERDHTWINDRIFSVYMDLYRMGFGHSIEAWKGDKLVGGLYGIAFRGAFFGESMFYRESNASKVCVVFLINALRKNDFKLLDIQMMTPHFRSFGAKEICKEEYIEILETAMYVERQFHL